jgi:hypothetical protein
MTKEEIIEMLDTREWPSKNGTYLLVGFSKDEAFSVHRVKYVSGEISNPVLTMLAPGKMKACIDWSDIKSLDNKQYMFNDELLKKYPSIIEAMEDCKE